MLCQKEECLADKYQVCEHYVEDDDRYFKMLSLKTDILILWEKYGRWFLARFYNLVFLILQEHISKLKNVMQKWNSSREGVRVLAGSSAEACSDALQVQTNCAWYIVVLALKICATDCDQQAHDRDFAFCTLKAWFYWGTAVTPHRSDRWPSFESTETVVRELVSHWICCIKGHNEIHKMLFVMAILSSKAQLNHP